MTHTYHHAPARASSGLDTARGGLASLTRGFAAWLRRRKADAETRRAGETLARMDEHLLRDIGIERDDAVRFARFGRD
jgi:uncharacterized protein YjiS (DUF1127 family)